MLESDEAAAIYSKCTLPPEFLTTLLPRGAGVWLVEATGETFARPPRVRVH